MKKIILSILLLFLSFSNAACSQEASNTNTIYYNYTIDFDLNGGTSVSYGGPKKVEEFSKDIFFFDCKKEGWNFRGWSQNGTKVFDENGNLLANPQLSREMIFVALYSQTAKMTIISNLEGAGNINGEGEYPYNTYVDVSANPKKGYLFIGWFYENTLLSNSNEYKYMMWSEDVILEARFKFDSYLMNVHTNNKDYGLVLLKSTYNEDYLDEYQEYRDYKSKVIISAYSKTNVRFLGWYDLNNKLVETNAVYEFFMPNYDIELEGKWNYFTVAYILNGGTNNSANPRNYTIDSGKLSLKDPTRNGYDFAGWTYNGKVVTQIDPTWIDNITLVANWKVHNYSISYELNGGVNSDSNPTTYTIESDTITLKDASRIGYKFDGWYKTKDFKYNKVAVINKGSYGDILLYAKWMIIYYSITYNLNGGINSLNNPSSYTIESEFSLLNPTKEGYSFLGWYDNEGNQIFSIPKGTTGAIIFNAKWNEGNEYSVTLDANGGSIDSTKYYFTYNDTYALPTPVRNGYLFEGWYDEDDLIPLEGIWMYSCNKTLVAMWSIIYYQINYSMDGGVNNPSNPNAYTIEDNFNFANPSKEGYKFLGWFYENELILGISYGTTGNIFIEARWEPARNSLIVKSNDKNLGTVEIIQGTGFSNETISIVATCIGDSYFNGWYNELVKVCDDKEYTFIMPASDYVLTAVFLSGTDAEQYKYGTIPTISADGNKIKYGLYPQSNVNDKNLISSLNNLADANENGWYFYEGNYYSKLVATPGNPSKDKFINGETIQRGVTYWFKCEPITWNIYEYNNNVYCLISEFLLDMQKYYINAVTRTINGETIYANNYKYSDIRSWLNNEFLLEAFYLGNQYINDTKVKNSASYVGYSGIYNKYCCEDTVDKVFLFSLKEYDNMRSNSNRLCISTDWARAKGAIYSTSSDCGIYWTRTPTDLNGEAVHCVGTRGQISGDYSRFSVYNEFVCVRPAITITL